MNNLRTTDFKISINDAAEYAKLPFIPPYLQPGFDNYIYGLNFASSGAGALAETHQGFVCGLAYIYRICSTICRDYSFCPSILRLLFISMTLLFLYTGDRP